MHDDEASGQSVSQSVSVQVMKLVLHLFEDFEVDNSIAAGGSSSDGDDYEDEESATPQK